MAKQTYGAERNWYAIHTYSGYEDAVARNLKQRIESFGMQEQIFNVVVPSEKKIKIKNGRRTETKEKTFPGYVLVEMIASDDAWSVVRNTPQVTGFVGTANQAVPLEQDEVDKILKRVGGDVVRHAIDLAAGTQRLREPIHLFLDAAAGLKPLRGWRGVGDDPRRECAAGCSQQGRSQQQEGEGIEQNSSD